MPPPDAVRDHYRTLQRLQAFLVVVGRRAWARMTPDFDRSWSQVAPALVSVTSAMQLAAAENAIAYVPTVLAETNQPDRPEARVRPRAFSGVASDGRSLEGLLNGAVVVAKRASGQGLTTDEALIGGRKWLEMALETAVADAARDAAATEVMVRQTMGWVRMVAPPCCRDCAVLAGKWFSWKADFERHPSCNCLVIPSAENVAGDFTTDPKLLLERGLIKGITKDQQARLDDGADLVKVLNEGRDRWRERMARERRRAKDAARRTTYGPAPTPLPPRSPAAFMAHLTNSVNANNASRTDAIDAMRDAGIVE